ncbi:DNA polymerase [Bradyrhizobium sp. SZCCHNR1023]|uniref:DNA polymerase n=2 Tax=Bradyrhizobium TaxID=374 RepID=UPI002916B9BB|nr:DNA polymerase [Bradyrhizobium sp. SZCCHNR1023]
MRDAVEDLKRAEHRVGHNIQRHDEKLLAKLTDFKPAEGSRLSDTMIIARTMFPSIKWTDDKLIEQGKLPAKLRGKHSLKAWGYRLGDAKGDYAEDREAEARAKGIVDPREIADYVWGEFNEDMFDYMLQDGRTNLTMWKHMNPEAYPQAPLELEHRIATVCSAIEDAGVPFDERAAGELQATLVEKKSGLEARLKEAFGFWYQPVSPDPTKALFVPKRPNEKMGYWGEYVDAEKTLDLDTGELKPTGKKVFKGYPFTKLKPVEFNPKSRDHIARVLMREGWKPEKLTDGGKPQIDEETVESIVARFPQMEGLGEYMMLEKRLSQLCGTDNALVQSVQMDGRIHGVINPGGTNTGRCSHFLPNLAQVPSAKKPYGTEFRRCFYAPRGWSFLGADQEGLELRGLAHFLHPMDGGKYAETVLSGDPHWANVLAMGLATGERDKHNQLHTVVREDGAKRFAYAVIYGAQDLMAGSIVYECLLNAQRTCGADGEALYREFFGMGVPGEQQIRKVGRKIRRNFAQGIEGFAALQERINTQVERKGRVPLLDGRLVPAKGHSALNYLIQGAGAVLCKRWVADAFEECCRRFKYGWDGDFVFVLFIHDEIQLCVREGLEEEIGNIVVKCAQEAGQPYGFRVRLDSKYEFGRTWADTH